MKSLDLSVGAVVEWRGRRYRITNAIIGFGEVEGQDVESGLHERLSIVDLEEPQEEVRGEVVSDLSLIDPDRFDEARRRQRAIETLLSLPKRRTSDAKRCADELGVTLSTVYEWMRLYRMDDRLTTLLPHRPNGGRGKGRLSDEKERLIQIAVEKHLTPQQLTARATVREVRRLCRAANIAPPSENTIRARINAIPEKSRMQLRGHKKDASDRFKARPGHYEEATQPLAVVQIDHTWVDVVLVDEEHRLPLRRPWLTVAFDVYSRMVLGFYVSFDTPGAFGTGLCIARSIIPKEKWLERYAIKHDWPCWGFPTKIHADNAREFRGELVRRACEQYGMSITFRPIKVAEYGGHIERYLGTFNKRVHELPGAALKPGKRGEYDSEGEAVYTLREFEEYMTVFITAIYHQEFHSGIGSSPIERWRKAILGDDRHPGTGLFPRPADEQRLLIDLMPVQERTIQNTGVTIDKVTYYSDVLRPYIRQSRNGSRDYIFRRDPRDISSIYFWDPDLQQHSEIPYRNLTHPAISIWELNEVRRKLEEQGRQNIDEDAIFEAYERLRQHQETAKAQTKAVRRVQERKKALEREREHTPRTKRSEATPPPRQFDAVKPLVAEESPPSRVSHFGIIEPLEIEEM